MPTHFLKVQGLPWERQRELLTRANAERWTVAALLTAMGPRKPDTFPAAPVAGGQGRAALAADQLRLGGAREVLID